MAKISRRTMLGGLLAGGAYTTLLPLLPRLGRVAHAQSMAAAYPTIFIHLPGGPDGALHWDAKTGITNRNVQAADIRETAAGIRWYQPVLAPLAAHMEDMCLIRNLRSSAGHDSGTGLLWFGEGNSATAASSTPWANYLSSSLLNRKRVAAPTLATFRTIGDTSIYDLVGHSNLSPNPAAAAQRIQGLTDFSDSLDVLGGLPPVQTQSRVYAFVEAMDQRAYSRTVQPRTTAAFEAGNVQASELLAQPPPQLWPPAQSTMDLFNLSSSDVTSLVTQNNQRFVAHVARAFEAARLQMSHVVFIQGTEGGYDTHENHDSGQRNRSSKYMPILGNLLSALKATASPVDPNVSMFDTTHVVITSELSRAARAETGVQMDGTPFDGTGTPHLDWTQAAMFGGNFKRGFAFGATDSNLRGIPADLTTGALNEGSVTNLKNLHATILKANGVDPSGWTTESPIDAVLKGG